jgi:DUF1680 family protein
MLTIDGGPIEVFLRQPDNSVLAGDQFEKHEDGYVTIKHEGGKQQYTYSLIPQVRVLKAHPRVSAAAGKLCVQRGLTTYCAEAADNAAPLSALRLPENAVFTEERVGWLGDSMPMLKTAGYSVSEENWNKTLYSPQSCVYDSREIALIPYSQWGNRGENEMRVWLVEK